MISVHTQFSQVLQNIRKEENKTTLKNQSISDATKVAKSS
jgi:hypothetical protein